ncbi:MAG TPA: S-layer homology domain-containing protein [Candidatus Scatomorpha gallistercoris]|nr:S-layer homology domain-containing protein [Candidatus Scatomorpha gallistercoris]
MKRLIPLLLALALILAACGAPTAEPSPSPSPTPYPASPQDLNTLPEPTVDPRIPQEPAVLAGPSDEGYTFTSDTQHFSIEIPDEAAPYVVICDGLTGYYPVGEAVSFCFYSYKYDTILGTFGTVIAYPREDFFDPTTIYNESSHAVCDVIKASEDYIYVHLGSVGGSDMPIEPLEGLDIAGDTIGFNALRENMVTLPADDMPALERDSLPAAAAGLNALGDAVMTRGDAAVFVTDILTADNKDRAYPLRFTDVAPGTDEARAIAYLDSYGVFARYTRGGDLISDGDLFRPDEPITRAEFVQLLQRVQFARRQISHYPISFGDSIPASDLDKGHFAYLELDRAWKDGWIELTDGLVRPDEAMTAAEMREALTALYRELVREDMSMPAADLEYNHYRLSGDVDDAVTAVVIIDEGGEKFRCWYGYERDGVIFCGILDESCAVLSREGVGSPYVIETDEPELSFELTTVLSDIACWQNIPFIYEPGQYAETNSLLGVVLGMSADEVVARFPADELYSCLSDGYIYGAEGGAYGIIGTDAGGRYIQYSDGEDSVRFSLDENDCVKVIEYIPG